MRFPYAEWPRWARLVALAALAVVALAVMVRLVLDPIATHLTRRSLSQLDGVRGDFDRVHVTLFGPGYTITRLKLIQHPGGDWKAPVFFAETVHVGVDWRRLFHRELVARARLVEPKITVISRPARGPVKPKAAKAPDISTQLQHVTPLKV